MEETAIPLYSWFWLVAPMFAVFLFSIVNYLRHRNRAKSAARIHKRNKPDGPGSNKKELSEKDVPEKPRDSGKDLPSG